jgi:DnaK suppressor protein
MDTNLFKERLEAEKVKLESEMSSLGHRNPAVPNDWEVAREEDSIEADLADQADIIVTRENTAAIFSDLEARYDAVIGALARIEQGTYGVCMVCGKPIQEARLGADPAATTCIEHR